MARARLHRGGDMTFLDLAKPILELGFPIVVAIYLLWDRSKNMDRFRDTLIKNNIGMQLILAKLNSLPEYEDLLKEYELNKGK